MQTNSGSPSPSGRNAVAAWGSQSRHQPAHQKTQRLILEFAHLHHAGMDQLVRVPRSVSASLIDLGHQSCIHIKFLDTSRQRRYQGTRYASWRPGRSAGRRYLKENKGVRWWIFWWPRLGWTWFRWTRLWWTRLGRARLRRTWLGRARLGGRLGRTRLRRTRLGRPRLVDTAGADPASVDTARRTRLRRSPQAGGGRHRRPAARRARERRADCAACF